MKYCPMCGTPNIDEAQVCTNCGRPFGPVPQPATPSQESATGAPPPQPQAQAAPASFVPPPQPQAQAAPASSAPPPQPLAPAAPTSFVAPPQPQASFAPTPQVQAAPSSPPAQMTLPMRMETLVVVVGFAAGALALLILIVISMVGEDKSQTVVLVRSFTNSLLDLYIVGLALYAGYNLVAHGLDLTKFFGKVPAWARWLLVGIAGYLIYVSATTVSSRLFRFVTYRSPGVPVPYLVEQFFEGLIVLVVAAIVYWRLSRHPTY